METTANQNPRAGVFYHVLRDAEPIPVWLAWWRRPAPALVRELVELASPAYRPT